MKVLYPRNSLYFCKAFKLWTGSAWLSASFRWRPILPLVFETDPPPPCRDDWTPQGLCSCVSSPYENVYLHAVIWDQFSISPSDCDLPVFIFVQYCRLCWGRRWSWLGHVLRMLGFRLVRQVLLKYVKPTHETLFAYAPNLSIENATKMSKDGKLWSSNRPSLRC